MEKKLVSGSGTTQAALSLKRSITQKHKRENNSWVAACIFLTCSHTQHILDAAGRLRSIINPLGQKTVYTPDALDRITLLTDAINGVTQFGYDPNSNLLTVTDAKGQQTVYTPNNMRTARKEANKPRPPAGYPLEAAYEHGPQKSTLDAFIWKQALWPDLPQQIH
jgi:YD repeat-containing protein